MVWWSTPSQDARKGQIPLGSTPMIRLDVFGGVMYLLFFAPFLFPLAPWFAKRPRGAWRVCYGAVAVLVLLSRPFLVGV